MRCHPAFRTFDAPREHVLDQYRLEILSPNNLEEDYTAVMESAERLAGFIGGRMAERAHTRSKPDRPLLASQGV